MQDLARPGGGGLRVQLVQPLVNVGQDGLGLRVVRPVRVLHDGLRLRLQALALVVDGHDGLQGGVVGGVHLPVEVINVNVLGDGHLPGAQHLEQGGLAAPVGADEAVAAEGVGGGEGGGGGEG